MSSRPGRDGHDDVGRDIVSGRCHPRSDVSRARVVVAGLASVAVLAIVVLVVPWALLRWGRLPRAEAHAWWGQLADDALSRATLFTLATVAAWAVWAMFIGCVVLEFVRQLRGARGSRLEASPRRRLSSRRLIVPVVLLLSGVQHSVAQAVSAGGAPSSVRQPVGAVTAGPRSVATFDAHTGRVDSGAAQLTALSPSAPTHAEGVVVTVERGDSPWGLAERHLGDGVRWRELFALNRGVLQPDGRAWTDPQTILVGWRLRLPPDEAVASRPSGRSTTTLVH
ncbi:MAG: LysM peptidoglycan-binding domain-containing protein, partial [Acidimicrobiia bacterium]